MSADSPLQQVIKLLEGGASLDESAAKSLAVSLEKLKCANIQQAAAAVNALKTILKDGATNHDDFRAAAQILIDASKTLASLGVAFIAALSVFAVTYASSRHSFTLLPSALLFFSAIATLISIIAGLNGIGKIVHTVANPKPDAPIWSTKNSKLYFGIQSCVGLLALGLFVWAVVVLNFERTSDPMEVHLGKIEMNLRELKNMSTIADQLVVLPRAQNEVSRLNEQIVAIKKSISDIERRIGSSENCHDESTLSDNNRKRVQIALARKGLNIGKIDGKFGDLTRDGIRSYQTGIGSQADGILTPVQIQDLIGPCR